MSRSRQIVVRVLGVVLALFVLSEVNYALLQPQSQLAIFALLGGVLCLLLFPERRLSERAALARANDWLLAGLLVLCCGWVVVQTEPVFSDLWVSGSSLGDRAGAEATIDLWVGGLGLLLVIEATRRCVGLALRLAVPRGHRSAWLGRHVEARSTTDKSNHTSGRVFTQPRPEADIRNRNG